MPGFGQAPFARRGNQATLFTQAADGLLSPSGDWTGDPQSGFAAVPSDPTRTTAKPVVRLIEPPDRYFSDQLSVGVMAFANDGGTLIGGIDRVRFHFEGNSVDVIEPSLRQFTRADGSNYQCPGYWVELKRPAGIAGTGHLYIEAIPADATMQKRTIGPYSYSMRDNIFDYELEVAPSQPAISGQRFQSLGAALFYLGVTTRDGDNNRITITEPGEYDFVGSSFSVFQGAGYTMIEATSPVTIGHKAAAASDISALARPKVNGLWFKGSNITLNFEHTLQLYKENGSREHVFDGVTITNLAGRDSYWRKGVRPIVPILGNPYFIDCTISNLNNCAVNANLVRGVHFTEVFGDLCTASRATIACKFDDHRNSFFASDLDAMTLNGPSGATLSLSGNNDVTSRTFTALENGAEIGAFTVGRVQTDFDSSTNYDVADVVAWANSLPGWSASLIDDTRRATALSARGLAGLGFTDLDVSSPQTLVTMFDLHADFYQQPFGVSSAGENILTYGNTGTDFTGQLVLLNSTNPQARDYVIANNAFHNNPDDTTAYSINSAFFSQFSGGTHSHIVFAHNSFANQGVLLRDDQALNQDRYCLFACNSVRSIRWNGSKIGAGVIANNHLHGGQLNTQGAVGSSFGGNENVLYQDALSGDFSPIGALSTSLNAPVLGLDINGNERGKFAPRGAVA